MHVVRGKCTKKQEISKEFWQNLHIGAGFVHFQNIFMEKNIEKRAWRRWGLKCLALSRHPPLNHKFTRYGIYPFTKRLQFFHLFLFYKCFFRHNISIMVQRKQRPPPAGGRGLRKVNLTNKK